MSNTIAPIINDVMGRIRKGKLAMRPRLLFVFGSILAFAGLVASVIATTFLVGLIRFSLRTHGPMGDYRFAQIMESFPWWSFLLAVVGLAAGIWLLRRYDFSYRHNFVVVVVVFVVAVILAGWLMDAIGFNDVLLHHGPLQGMMRGYAHQNAQQGTGWRWGR